jgi:uroporphyrinogen-III synthase
MPPVILITRPQEDALSTAADVAALGFTPLCDPVIRIHPEPFTPPDWTGIDGILVTSGHAVAALQDVPRDKSFYVVGERTAEKLRAAGFTRIAAIVPQSEDLPAAILKAEKGPGTLFHPSSSHAHTQFYAEIRQAGFDVLQKNVYRADAAEQLSAETVAGLKQEHIKGVLFYSPRSASLFCGLAQRAQLLPLLQKVEAFCFSAAVAAASGEKLWKTAHIAAMPTHLSLMDRLAKSGMGGAWLKPPG